MTTFEIIILTVVSLMFICSLFLFVKWYIYPIHLKRVWNKLKINDIYKYKYIVVDAKGRCLEDTRHYTLISKTDVERKMVTLQNLETGDIIRVRLEQFIINYERV